MIRLRSLLLLTQVVGRATSETCSGFCDSMSDPVFGAGIPWSTLCEPTWSSEAGGGGWVCYGCDECLAPHLPPPFLPPFPSPPPPSPYPPSLPPSPPPPRPPPDPRPRRPPLRPALCPCSVKIIPVHGRTNVTGRAVLAAATAILPSLPPLRILPHLLRCLSLPPIPAPRRPPLRPALCPSVKLIPVHGRTNVTGRAVLAAATAILPSLPPLRILPPLLRCLSLLPLPAPRRPPLRPALCPSVKLMRVHGQPNVTGRAVLAAATAILPSLPPLRILPPLLPLPRPHLLPRRSRPPLPPPPPPASPRPALCPSVKMILMIVNQMYLGGLSRLRQLLSSPASRLSVSSLPLLPCPLSPPASPPACNLPDYCEIDPADWSTKCGWRGVSAAATATLPAPPLPLLPLLLPPPLLPPPPPESPPADPPPPESASSLSSSPLRCCPRLPFHLPRVRLLRSLRQSLRLPILLPRVRLLPVLLPPPLLPPPADPPPPSAVAPACRSTSPSPPPPESPPESPPADPPPPSPPPPESPPADPPPRVHRRPLPPPAYQYSVKTSCDDVGYTTVNGSTQLTSLESCVSDETYPLASTTVVKRRSVTSTAGSRRRLSVTDHEISIRPGGSQIFRCLCNLVAPHRCYFFAIIHLTNRRTHVTNSVPQSRGTMLPSNVI